MVDPYPPGVGYRNLYKKFQFIGNFKVNLRLEFHIKIHGMAGTQCAFSAQRAGNGRFSLTLPGISSLTQLTPCV